MAVRFIFKEINVKREDNKYFVFDFYIKLERVLKGMI